MCTVSFVPLANDNFIFTSNRDEAIGRTTLIPDFYTKGDLKIWMPKDEKSGGTWIGVTHEKKLVCLLNGAFEAHVKKDNYRHSRGVVVHDFLLSKNVTLRLKDYNLQNIEPFTLIILDWKKELKVTELIWDGSQKYISKLPIEAKIWSSATLYTAEMKNNRVNWFSKYLSENEKSQDVLLNFHQNYEVGDKNINLQIDRGSLKTVSITSVEKKGAALNMKYVDLLHNKTYAASFQKTETIQKYA